ncbi:AAA family ATPase [Marinomonas sp. 15G1-11]|uniref:AAA family ATPase n=1 Tax=Marinomonas phaeophyticola TaxID=3004091 RepID=A0ABT4JVV9_9GAMM|nr:AAA family ATPase [Marinomonas sp. 15G1-11]MCZ2722385.1 AAA family ATPase [Marinomonas sp. 15G1-11]
MAKPKKNIGKQPQGRNNTVNHPKDKAELEKQIPTWSASFENASKIYKAFGQELEINIEQSQLENVVKHISEEGAKTVSDWVSQFAKLCSDLSKYYDSLNGEYEERWDICNLQGQVQEEERSKISAEQLSLKSQSEDMIQQKEELEQQEKKLGQLQCELTDRESDIRQRELNAESGFEKEKRNNLEQLISEQDAERHQYREDISNLSQQKAELERAVGVAKIKLTEAEQQCKAELEEKNITLMQQEAELNSQRSDLEKEQERLELEKKNLEEEKRVYTSNLDLKNHYEQERIKKQHADILEGLNIEKKRLDDDWEDLSHARKNHDALLDESMEQERESHCNQVSRLEKKCDTAWAEVDVLKEKLEDIRELEASLGDLSVSDFLQKLKDLEQENRGLKRQYSESDTAGMEEENASLRGKVDSLEQMLREMGPELEHAQAENRHKRIAATELQASQQENRVLVQHKNTLSVHIDDLESRINQLTDAHKTQTPFPAMSKMDNDKNFVASIELEFVPDLAEFAKELQQRIAQAEDNVRLYYPLEDIRVLLGGLAMSQLHVFQGISGTGKTSLAKAFAKAMGGFCTDIAVQAGWRDRDDLLGHYNAFERRYYEKDCLQALYQAQTPRWNDTCNVILLDEMNLSRPEQYFSEFLSALEKNDAKERLISLSETALPNAPKGLKEERKILVPNNVWFIGTANHDETTNELADKTYDRSHVMTLPKQEESFEIKDLDKTSYSYESLQKAFQHAVKKHEEEVEKLLYMFAEHDICKQLSENFGLGLGNRFDRQAKRFIPVMLATGATNGEALDHLLSTRVMRNGKVTGRYDVSSNDINQLSIALKDFWETSELQGEPIKSLELLEVDIKRMEHG